ncbi:VCBS repeat-containing protein [bacterium]|nr:VCBS repeat-containing protein [bacterium]
MPQRIHHINISQPTRRAFPRKKYVALALVVLLLAACGSDEKKNEAQGNSFDSTGSARRFDIGGASLVDSLAADLNGDGIAEAILFSLSDTLGGDPLLQENFDRVDIFDSSAGSAKRLFFDVIEDGSRAECGDVTGDGVQDLIVEVDAGGNNPLISRGMHLYGLNEKGEVTLLFYINSGAPELRDLDGDGSSEILVSDQFWGMMAHSEAIVYTREIFAFDGSSYSSANARFVQYFDRMLRERTKRYEEEKHIPHLGDESRLRLYRRAADLLAWSYARGGASRIARVWRKEEQFLKGELYEEQFEDLSVYVDEVQSLQAQPMTGVS